MTRKNSRTPLANVVRARTVARPRAFIRPRAVLRRRTVSRTRTVIPAQPALDLIGGQESIPDWFGLGTKN